jgi:hypothetical protein
MLKQFEGQEVQAVFSTELYGSFQGRQDLSVEEELAADKGYWVDEHGLNVPIAIHEPDTTVKDRAARKNPNDKNYCVSAIPQVVLIDKNGIIRRIFVGWDPVNDTRVPEIVQQLLNQAKKGASKP